MPVIISIFAPIVSSADESGTILVSINCGTRDWYNVGGAVFVKIYCVTRVLAYSSPANVSTRCTPIAFCALTFE